MTAGSAGPSGARGGGGTPPVRGRARTWAAALLLGLCATPLAALPAAGQAPNDTVSVAAGPHYAAGALRRFVYGDNWRELWTAPVRVPVLDIDTFAGGLSPLRQGGGSQTISLHMETADGERWAFRSIDKRPGGSNLPWEVRGTPAERMLGDHVSALHPGGHFAVPAILEAVGILHTPPTLFVMPDHPRLGEHRETFAGMLGGLELRPNQGPDETPGFAGSRRIWGWSNFIDALSSGHQHRLDEAELLRARLVDMLVGDPDRGTDQWRWARYGDEGAYTWRPIPEDRDWVFAHADGLFAGVARGTYVKLVEFTDRYPPIERFTFSSHIVDRTLLTRLTRADFEREAEAVRSAVTDDVIDRAVAAMPAPWAARSGDDIRATLRARRDALPQLALAYYAWIADAVDVRGTAEHELVRIERRADGAVHVRITRRSDDVRLLAAGDAQPAPRYGDNAPSPLDTTSLLHVPYFERTFLPSETNEVRVHLPAGDNHVRVTGVQDGPITIRVIGGSGADLFEDLAGNVRFYKQQGELRVVRSAGTRVDGRRWSPPAPPEGLRGGYSWAPDWGRDSGVTPATSYDERSGALFGAAITHTTFGFRRLPFRSQFEARAFYAPRTGGVRAELQLDHRLENSRRGVRLDVQAIRADEFPFFAQADAGGTRVVLDYDAVRIEPALVWWLGARPGLDPAANLGLAPGEERGGAAAPPMRAAGELRIGPSFGWTRMDGPPLVDADDVVTQLGVRSALRLRRHEDRPAPRRGFRVDAGASAYPVVSGAGTFGDIAAVAAAYVPLLGDGPHLALRAGGERVFGDFPLFEGAFLGGRHSLRGSRTHEHAGDTRAYGTAELRVPVDTVRLYINMEFGVFGFGDAGRVWTDGTSPAGWRAGWGGGAWLAAFGRAASIAVARGDRSTRVHAWFGLPF